MTDRPGASPPRRPTARLRAATAAVDQLLYSLSNFVLAISVARVSTPLQFGGFSVVISTFLFVISANRGFSAEPLIIRHASLGDNDQKGPVSQNFASSVGVGVIGGVLILVLSVLGLPPSAEWIGIALAIAAPFAVVQDYLRYSALVIGRPAIAARSDALAVAVFGVGLLIAFMTGVRCPWFVMGLWGVGEAFGLALAALDQRVFLNVPHMMDVLRDRDLGVKLAIDNIVSQIAQQGASYLVVGLVGFRSAGGLRAAQTAASPISTLTQSVQTAVMPELVRSKARGTRALQLGLFRLAVLLGVSTAAAVVIVCILPNEAGLVIFGSSWNLARPLLPFIGVGLVAGSVGNVAVIGLRVIEAPRRILQARLFAVSVTVLSLVVGTKLNGGRGAAEGIAAGSCLQAVVWWVCWVISIREFRRLKSVARNRSAWQTLVGEVDPIAVVALVSRKDHRNERGSPGGPRV